MSELNLAGGKYVYFKSLPDSAYTFGLGIVTSINNMLLDSVSENPTLQHIDNIGKYINFVKTMATSAHSNEVNFLKQQLSQLSKLKNNDERLTKWFKAFEKGEIDYDNYQQLIKLFNDLLIDKNYNKIVSDEQIQRMTHVRDIFTRFPKEIRAQIEQAYAESYQRYRAIYKSEEKNISNVTYDQFTDTLSQKIATKINGILQNFSTDGTYKNILVETFEKQDTLEAINDQEFKSVVINYIVDLVLSDGLFEENTIDILSDRVVSQLRYNFKNLIEQYKDEEYSNGVLNTSKSIEELALTTTDSLAMFVTKIDAKSVEEIKSKYGDETLNKQIDKFIGLVEDTKKNADKIKELQGRITRKLRTQIKNEAKKRLPSDTEIKSMTSDKFDKLFKRTDFITSTNLREGLKKGLSGLSVSSSTVAEFFTLHEVPQQIANTVFSGMGGNKIKEKADVLISTGHCSLGSNNLFDEQKVTAIIKEVIKSQYENFSKMYWAQSSGKTNIDVAMDTYGQWLSEMKKQIDEIIDADAELKGSIEAKRQVYEEMNKTFSISISVKDYDLYNNTLGFHGGSLGSQTAPQQVMENIYNMYKLGGINSITVDTLMTAVINCGDAMIGDFLRPSLEAYLLGGAALIMFDDSFTLSENFLKNIKEKFTEIGDFKGQQTVNIYRINSKYVPSSFVLTKIGNNLEQIYADIIANNPITNTGNKVTIINNVTESILEDESIKSLPPQEKWEKVRDYTASNIHIQFTFMGGLLDILEEIPAAFDV